MTTIIDPWGQILSGGAVTVTPEDGEPYALAIRDAEYLAQALYERATLEFAMNQVPPEMEAAGREMLKAANAFMGAMVKLAECTRSNLEQRDGPFTAPPPAAPDGQKPCPDCDGSGTQFAMTPNERPCARCDGSGSVDPIVDNDVMARSDHRPKSR